MIAIISDLHLRPDAYDSLRFRKEGQVHEIGIRCNVAPAKFKECLTLIGEFADRCHAAELHLVFAGDTFAMHQKPLIFMDIHSWTQHNEALGPDDPQQNPRLQQVLGFLAATGLEHQALRDELQSFLRKPPGRKLRSIQTYYLPGVHDRLVNGWPATRKWAADFLQLSHPPNRPFSETLNFANLGGADHEVHIRQNSDLHAPSFKLPVSTGPRRNPAAGNHQARAFSDYISVDTANHQAFAFRVFMDQASGHTAASGTTANQRHLFHDLISRNSLLDAEKLRPAIWLKMLPMLEKMIPAQLHQETGQGATSVASAELSDLLRGLAKNQPTGEFEVLIADDRYRDKLDSLNDGTRQKPDSVARGEPWQHPVPYGQLLLGRQPGLTLMVCYNASEQAAKGDQGRHLESWIGHRADGSIKRFELPIPAPRQRYPASVPVEFNHLQLLDGEPETPSRTWKNQALANPRQRELNDETTEPDVRPAPKGPDIILEPSVPGELWFYGIEPRDSSVFLDRLSNRHGRGGWLVSKWLSAQ